MKQYPTHSRLLVIGLLVFTAALFFAAYSFQNTSYLMTNALRMIASQDPAELLEISLDKEKVELELGESYTFTSYGRYYTTTVPTSVYWNIDDKTLGELSCEQEKAKTCTFLSGKKAGDTLLTISLEQKGTTFTDTANIKIIEPLKSSFKDELPSWARKGILKLNKLGIIKGYNDGRFGASDAITRSQVVTLLYRFKDSMKTLDPTVMKNKKCDVFSDVPSSHFAYTPICYFYYSSGLDVKGKTFDPDSEAPRGLTSFYLYNVFANDLKKTSSSTSKTASFSDVPRAHPYYNAISSMNNYGVMTGYDNGSFGPDNTLNRAEAATVIFRVNGLLENITEPSSSTATGNDTLLSKCDNEADTRKFISQALGDNLSEFELRQFQPDVLSKQLSTGTLDLSFVDKNAILTPQTVTISPDIIRLSGVTSASVKNLRDGNNAQSVALPSEQGYKLTCKNETQCGVLTLLDEENTEIEATFVDAELGFSFLEPASNLIALSGASQSEVEAVGSCHVFYNSAQHTDVLSAQHAEGDAISQALHSLTTDTLFPKAQAVAATDSDDLFIGQIPIVLDADQEFYQINTRTAWSRQRSVLAGGNLIYGLVDALGHESFSIVFRIAGQEAWLPGYGPTELDWEKVLEEINAEDYYMINHPDPDKNALSYFFIGYDLANGVAGGAYEGTFCSEDFASYNHALGQQVPDSDENYAFSTLYGRQIVMSHEIGHMLNANHDSAESNVCGVGLWSSICGSTLLRSGAAGGADPDNRKFFFSAANSERVRDCASLEL